MTLIAFLHDGIDVDHGNISDRDDRWALIEQDTLGAYENWLHGEKDPYGEMVKPMAERVEEYRMVPKFLFARLYGCTVRSRCPMVAAFMQRAPAVRLRSYTLPRKGTDCGQWQLPIHLEGIEAIKAAGRRASTSPRCRLDMSALGLDENSDGAMVATDTDRPIEGGHDHAQRSGGNGDGHHPRSSVARTI